MTNKDLITLLKDVHEALGGRYVKGLPSKVRKAIVELEKK
jgi:hypothetical protein